MFRKIRNLLDREKAKDIINERGFYFCPSCGMMLRLKMKEEVFCSYCGQRLRRTPENGNNLP